MNDIHQPLEHYLHLYKSCHATGHPNAELISSSLGNGQREGDKLMSGQLSRYHNSTHNISLFAIDCFGGSKKFNRTDHSQEKLT
jgi:hypothetical protein